MHTSTRHLSRSTLSFAVLLALAGCQSSPVAETSQPPPPEEPAVQLAKAAASQDPLREQESRSLDRVVVTGTRVRQDAMLAPASAPPPAPPAAMNFAGMADIAALPPSNTENYTDLPPNPVQRASEQPLSTFSIDVDTGSYSNLRRMLSWGQRPPKDAVRVEEMLNYFDYGYAPPASRAQPFAVHTELAAAPWNSKRLLMRVGLKAYEVPAAELPPANLVFLIDTSGSMQDADKLPLVKLALRELAQQLRPQDRVSIVVYAGSAGLVLPPTSGAEKASILAALDQLEAGGSTNGGEGIALAYQVARQSQREGGINRVILATDGDFNVGTTDQTALETLVSEQRKHGIALSTLGFGQGNYNDAMAEKLADVGDGNHSYIDTPREAIKVLRDEMAGTLLTVAKDVKIQVEFNPAQVAEYRLIGYENRQLKREDFANDAVDAGEIGAGHDVTALYEIALVGSGGEWNAPLKYAASSAPRGNAAELATVRLRYKAATGGASRLLQQPVTAAAQRAQPSPSIQWAAAVAAYGERLRGGEALVGFGWAQVAQWIDRAALASPNDSDGTRAELRQLVRTAAQLDGETLADSDDKPLQIAGD